MDLMDLSVVGQAVTEIDRWLDGDVQRGYKEQPMAQDWARLSKVIEEAGEAISNFIAITGQNPRKGVYSSDQEFLSEVADIVMTGVMTIQHFTKDYGRTEEILWDKLMSLRERVPDEYRIG